MGGTVRASDGDVGVNDRLCALERDVADEREHLDLLAHRDPLVVTPRRI